MRSALQRANRILDRDQIPRDANRLAQRVMALFDRGLRDEEIIAKSAAYQETLVVNTALIRDSVANNELLREPTARQQA